MLLLIHNAADRDRVRVWLKETLDMRVRLRDKAKARDDRTAYYFQCGAIDTLLATWRPLTGDTPPKKPPVFSDEKIQ